MPIDTIRRLELSFIFAPVLSPTVMISLAQRTYDRLWTFDHALTSPACLFLYLLASHLHLRGTLTADSKSCAAG
jgi:hypothetical protein